MPSPLPRPFRENPTGHIRLLLWLGELTFWVSRKERFTHGGAAWTWVCRMRKCLLCPGGVVGRLGSWASRAPELLLWASSLAPIVPGLDLGLDAVAHHALISKLIIHWSRDCACTDYVADHALIMKLIIHWRGRTIDFSITGFNKKKKKKERKNFTGKNCMRLKGDRLNILTPQI